MKKKANNFNFEKKFKKKLSRCLQNYKLDNFRVANLGELFDFGVQIIDYFSHFLNYRQ